MSISSFLFLGPHPTPALAARRRMTRFPPTANGCAFPAHPSLRIPAFPAPVAAIHQISCAESVHEPMTCNLMIRREWRAARQLLF